MGVFSRFRRGSKREELRPSSEQKPNVDNKDVVVGAQKQDEEKIVQTFSNANITFSGALAGYDYDSILRDKQANITSLFELADYYVDADPIVRGIVKHVLVPYTAGSDWVLTGAKEKTCQLFEEHYKKIRLKEIFEGIALEYWKYGNVFTYVHQGHIITLPVNKCKIGNVTLNGVPIVDYDCQSIINEWRSKSYTVKENWIKDNNLEDAFAGFPEEVQEGLNKGDQYVQLDPHRSYVLQAPKESWHRYAIPFIASCLTPLSKKELVSQYEDSILNLAIRSFVHVNYGDPTKGADMLPDRQQLAAVRNLFSQAMNGFPLVVTNQLAKATVVQPKMDDLFQFDKYRQVNNDILSAGGISGILVSGVAEDGSTFASAQVSMQTVEQRIEAARREICNLMNRINVQLVQEIEGTYNLKEIPRFEFKPLSMAGKQALRDTCMQLWEKGCVSTQTMLHTHGYSMSDEKAQREKEASDNVDEVLKPRVMAPQMSPEDEGGRPTLDDNERNSDPAKSKSGRQPKPSNPEGSEPKEET